MTKFLALETATDACSVALLVGDKLTQRFEIAPRRHAEIVLTMVDQLLNESGLALQDIEAIAYGMGPGSFMGARLATGIAQGLAFGVAIPVVPVSTLAALALRASQETGAQQIAVAWDARMEEVYWGCYQVGGGQVQAVVTDKISAPDKIVLPNGCDWKCVGNAWQVYKDKLPLNVPGRSVLLHPSAAQVAEIAASKTNYFERVAAVEAKPNYIRQRVVHKKN